METNSPAPIAPVEANSADSSDKWQEEIARLKLQLVSLPLKSRCWSKCAPRTQTCGPNWRNLPPLPADLQTVLDEVAKAKARAASIACVNNLKQLGLSFRVWAMDNGNRFPANVPLNEGGAVGSAGVDPRLVFLVMSNELYTLKFSSVRRTPTAWPLPTGPRSRRLTVHTSTWANTSSTKPSAVLAICPIHGHVVMCDVSVQGGVGQDSS